MKRSCCFRGLASLAQHLVRNRTKMTSSRWWLFWDCKHNGQYFRIIITVGIARWIMQKLIFSSEVAGRAGAGTRRPAGTVCDPPWSLLGTIGGYEIALGRGNDPRGRSWYRHRAGSADNFNSHNDHHDHHDGFSSTAVAIAAYLIN